MRPNHLLSTFSLGLSILATPLAMHSTAIAQSADTRTLKIAAPWEVVDLDPSTQGYMLQRMQIAETLVDADEKGVLRPGLSTKWSVSEDGLTWRFAILGSATFHDGSVVNAEVVATALNHAIKKPGNIAKAPITKIMAEGNEVVMALSEPFAALPAFLTHSTAIILSPGSYDDAGKVKQQAFGTGPFKIESFNPPLKLTVARFDNYRGNAPAVARAQYSSTSRAETRALLAESGQADLVFTLDPSGTQLLRGVEGVTVTSVAIPRVVILKLNAAKPSMSDPKAREAISLAIDRAGIAAGILRQPEAAANQVFAPVLSAWHDATTPVAMRDSKRAKELLTELGWTAADDGILTRDGERFRVVLRTFPDRPELPLIASALQAQLREVGIEMEISISSFSEIPAGHQDGTLDMGLFARNFGTTPDPIGAALADFSNGGGDWGAMNWKRDDVTTALKSIAATADKAKRADPIRIVREALANDRPVLPITWYQHTVAQSARINGVVIDPLERTYNLSGITWAK